MDAKLKDLWEEFLRGRWIETMPSEPGTYPIADYLGTEVGTSIVYIGKDGTPTATKPWSGYWWSKPYPPLPRRIPTPE